MAVVCSFFTKILQGQQGFLPNIKRRVGDLLGSNSGKQLK